jgi:lipopolysaccharide export system permease protein
MTLDRYLAREILRPTLGVFIFLTVVVLVFYASKFLARAAVEGLPMDVVLQMSALRLTLFYDVLIPASLLLGIVIGLGRLQSAYEIIAVAAAGVGRMRILSALAGWVLLLAILVGALSLFFRPWAYSTLYALEQQVAAEVDVERVEPGRFHVGDQQWLIYAEGRSDGGLDEVLVHQRGTSSEGLLRARRLEQINAPDGLIRLVFSGDVRSYRTDPMAQDELIGRFERFEVAFQSRPPPERDQLRRAMTTPDLLDSTDSVEVAELSWRLVSPLSVLVLSLAAVAMSRVNPRLGQSARVMTATLTGTLYFSLMGVLINWLEQGTISPWPGAFVAPMAVLLILVVRYWLVQRGPGAPL